MNNFEFYNPVRICFGKNEIAKLSKLVPKVAPRDDNGKDAKNCRDELLQQR